MSDVAKRPESPCPDCRGGFVRLQCSETGVWIHGDRAGGRGECTDPPPDEDDEYDEVSTREDAK